MQLKTIYELIDSLTIEALEVVQDFVLAALAMLCAVITMPVWLPIGLIRMLGKRK